MIINIKELNGKYDKGSKFLSFVFIFLIVVKYMNYNKGLVFVILYFFKFILNSRIVELNISLKKEIYSICLSNLLLNIGN